jgi:hypothetical protein
MSAELVHIRWLSHVASRETTQCGPVNRAVQGLLARPNPADAGGEISAQGVGVLAAEYALQRIHLGLPSTARLKSLRKCAATRAHFIYATTWVSDAFKRMPATFASPPATRLSRTPRRYGSPVQGTSGSVTRRIMRNIERVLL